MKKWVQQWLGPPGGETTPPGDSISWVTLNDPAQLAELGKKGAPAYRVVFKHSTRCGLSAMMLRRFEATWKGHASDTAFYLLDLIRHRELSEEVARQFGLYHQSPQVLIIRDGVLVDSASHGDIAGLAPDRFRE